MRVWRLSSGIISGHLWATILTITLLSVMGCEEKNPPSDADGKQHPVDGGLDHLRSDLGDSRVSDGPAGDGPEVSSGQFWPPYAQSGWPSIHHDPFGSDFTFAEAPMIDTLTVSRFDAPRVTYLFGSTLDAQGQPTGKGGIALPIGATMDLKHGRGYAVVLKPGMGRLYAFYSREENGHKIGEIAWNSDQCPDAAGKKLDNCAGSSVPLIDDQGNLYINGCEQFWSYTKEGTLRWTAPMPTPRSGEGNAVFISAVFTRQVQLADGRTLAGVGGVTIDGQAVFFDIKDGRALLNAPYVIPDAFQDTGGEPPPDSIFTECLWTDVEGVTMVDPTVAEKYVSGLFGVGMAVANTPAVLPDPQRDLTTRIYIPVLVSSTSSFDGKLQNDTRLVRLDLTYTAQGQAAVEEPASWTTLLADGSRPGMMPGGNGSATSPDVSPDGKLVFSGDSNGILFAFDAESGAQKWTMHPGKMMGSITTTWPQNTELYFYAEGRLKKYNIGNQTPTPATQPVAVQDFRAVAEGALDKHLLFDRVGMASGIAVTTPTRVYIPVTLGYQVMDQIDLAIWPMRSVLVVMDRGLNIINTVNLPDESELAGAPDEEGNFFVMYASMMSSLSHCMWRKGLGNKLGLPEPLRPSGGLTIFHN